MTTVPGRGLSGPFGTDHGLTTEVDDLRGLLTETGARNVFGGTPPRERIPTMHYDAITIEQAAGPLARFAGVRAETLLLGGARSAPYLKAALNGLEPVLPRVRRVTLPGWVTSPRRTTASR